MKGKGATCLSGRSARQTCTLKTNIFQTQLILFSLSINEISRADVLHISQETL